MPIYYLCSGFGMEHSFVNKFEKLLSADLPVRNTLVAIPCAENPEELQAHFSFFTEQLAEAGIVFNKHVILSSSMSHDEQCDYIKNANFIYFMGGYPFAQKEFILQNKLEDALRSYSGVVLGISAGAMNMSKYIIMVTDGPESNETRIEDGLGLVDFSVFPHCAFSGDNFAPSFCIGSDLVDSKALLQASQGMGTVYFLQNKTETDTLKISFIRVKNNNPQFVSMFDGKVWKATENGFEIMKEYI